VIITRHGECILESRTIRPPKNHAAVKRPGLLRDED
jgi:hypothetical protein